MRRTAVCLGRFLFFVFCEVTQSNTKEHFSFFFWGEVLLCVTWILPRCHFLLFFAASNTRNTRNTRVHQVTICISLLFRFFKKKLRFFLVLRDDEVRRPAFRSEKSVPSVTSVPFVLPWKNQNPGNIGRCYLKKKSKVTQKEHFWLPGLQKKKIRNGAPAFF